MPRAASQSDLCLGLARGASVPRVASFWKLAAGFFEAQAHGLLPADVYVQARGLARAAAVRHAGARRQHGLRPAGARPAVLLRAGRARPARRSRRPCAAVRVAWGVGQRADGRLRRSSSLGRFDPAGAGAGAQAHRGGQGNVVGAVGRRRAAHAAGWPSSSRSRRFAAEAASAERADGRRRCNNAVDASLRSASRPRTELAMEVATSVLYLEAAFEDLDPHDRQLTAAHGAAGRPHRARARGRPPGAARSVDGGALPPRHRPPDHGQRGRRTARLAERARKVARPVLPQPDATRACCARCRASCCRCAACSRCSAWTRPSQAVLRMRDERRPTCWPTTTTADSRRIRSPRQQPRRAGLPDRHAQLPAALAKSLFVFDAEAGELKPLMGRRSAERRTAVPAASARWSSRLCASAVRTPSPVTDTRAERSSEARRARSRPSLAALARPRPRKRALSTDRGIRARPAAEL